MAAGRRVAVRRAELGYIATMSDQSCASMDRGKRFALQLRASGYTAAGHTLHEVRSIIVQRAGAAREAA
jgi:hypothetical protein